MKRTRSIVLALALGAACGSPQKEADTLGEAIRSYNDGIRWQRYAIAASRILPKQRGDFVDQMDERAEDLRITDYEIVRVDTRSDREAHVQIKVSWYRDSEGLLKDTVAVQTWERHGKVWFMVDESRKRGDEMPGLPERATQASEENH